MKPVGFIYGRRLCAYRIAVDASLLNEKRGHRPMNDMQYRREQFVMEGKETAQGNQERQHTLTYRNPGDTPDEEGRCLNFGETLNKH